MTKHNFLLAASAFALLAAGAAQAQETAQQSIELQDIIVTATKRAQALQDVPIAVSAVTGDALAATGATDIRQLNQLAPSLLVSSTSSEAGGGVARIRGIGTVGDNPGLESSVAVFIDGVYRNRSGVGLTELGNIDRIEVLRGPQGTLFGRNASAGLINVVTKKPSFETGGYGEASYGNYDYYRFGGGVTGAVVKDILAASLDGAYIHRDGFLRDTVSGRTINDRDRWLLRGQLFYTPNDDVSLRIIGDYAKRDEECCGATYLPTRTILPGANQLTVVPTSGATSAFLPGGIPSIAGLLRSLGATINDDTFNRVTSITPGRDYRSNVEDWGVSGELNWDFGAASFTAITAYRDWHLLRGQDADFNNLDILYRDGWDQQFRTFSQEARFQGKWGKLDWLFGGYYAHEKLDLTDNLKYGNDYTRYANCLVALNFATNPDLRTLSTALGITQSNLLSTSGPGCFNSAAANTLGTALTGLGSSTGGVLRLLSGNAIPGLGGFQALAAAPPISRPGLSLNNVGATRDDYNHTSNNWALFTHNVFNVTDRLSITIGVRFTHESKDLDANLAANNTLCTALSNSPFITLNTLPCVVNSNVDGAYTSKRSESEWSGTGVISYKATDDLLVYASYSRGYKAGGYNLDRSALINTDVVNRTIAANLVTIATSAPTSLAFRNATDAVNAGRALLAQLSATRGNFVTSTNPGVRFDSLQFEPETVDAVELGAKYGGRFFNLNGALFYQKVHDFQLNTFNGINFVVENLNAVEAYGIELEALARPVEGLTISMGGTVSSTEYTQNATGSFGQPLSAPFFQLPGNQISNAPRYVINGSAGYEIPLGKTGLTTLFYGDFRYQGEINTGSDLDIEKVQEGFLVVNARLGFYGPNKRWGFELWAQNLLGKDYQQVAFDAPLQGSGTTRAVAAGTQTSATSLYGTFLGEPRTFGLTVKGKF